MGKKGGIGDLLGERGRKKDQGMRSCIWKMEGGGRSGRGNEETRGERIERRRHSNKQTASAGRKKGPLGKYSRKSEREAQEFIICYC